MAFRDFFRWRAASPAAAPRASASAAGVTITSSQDLENYLRAGAGGTKSGAAVTADSSLCVAPVYACVRLISGAVATMPLAIKRRVDARTREDASDHPLWSLFRRRPNKWMTPSGFRRTMTAHLLLRGNAFALKVSARGRVTELWPLHPDRVSVAQLDDMSIVYTYTRRDGRKITLPQSEIFHLVGLTLDGVTGVSVIHYAREALGVAMQTEAHGATMFKNGTSIGGVIKHPGSLGGEGEQNLRASLEQYRGAENAHKNLILEEGMDYTPLGMTSEDAQYIETRRFTRSEIAMFFGVPPHMIGDTDKATSWGSGIEQQAIGFVAYTLQDYLTAWEETIGRDLVGDDEPDVFAKFNTGGLIRGDVKTRYSAYAIARQWGWMSINDVRELEDQNPIEGGDDYLQPLNMQPAGAPTKDDPDEPAQTS